MYDYKLLFRMKVCGLLSEQTGRYDREQVVLYQTTTQLKRMSHVSWNCIEPDEQSRIGSKLLLESPRTTMNETETTFEAIAFFSTR